MPKSIVENIFLITDKPHDSAFDKATLINANDNNDFIKRFMTGIQACQTNYFLLLLDDYFVTEINYQRFTTLLDYIQDNKIDYCKLYCRNKKYLIKNKPYYLLNTSFKYAVDLYPGIWNRSFAKSIVDEWNSDNRTIWHFEANMCKQPRVINSKECICAINKELCFLDVVRKGKMIRHSYRYLKKRNIKIEGLKKRSIWSAFKDHASVFLMHHTPSKIKTFIKKHAHKNSFEE